MQNDKTKSVRALTNSKGFPPKPKEEEKKPDAQSIAKILGRDRRFILTETPKYPVYPCANELNFGQTIDASSKAELGIADEAKKTSAALFFGESNLSSFYPEIANQKIQLVIQADFHPAQIGSFRHTRKCLTESASIKDFEKKFMENNPLAREREFAEQAFKYSSDKLSPTERLREIVDHSCTKLLPAHHFLSDDERYKKCHQAANKLAFAAIGLDLTNPLACYQLLKMLAENNVEVVMFNFSNIWRNLLKMDEDTHAVSLDTYIILLSIYILTSLSTKCVILYSKHQEKISTKETIIQLESQMCLNAKAFITAVFDYFEKDDPEKTFRGNCLHIFNLMLLEKDEFKSLQQDPLYQKICANVADFLGEKEQSNPLQQPQLKK